MREILFRGKIFDSGKWLYGSWFHKDIIRGGVIKHIHFIIPAGAKSEWLTQGTTFPDEKVLPETFGQYTGIDDMDGAKVFEGDAVRCKTESDGERIGFIRYSDEAAAYYLDCINGYSNCLLDVLHDFEIIGNIFDGFDSSEPSEDEPSDTASEPIKVKYRKLTLIEH